MIDFFIDEFQKEIWQDHYRYNNETIDQTFMRIAFTIFSDVGLQANQLLLAMLNKRISFGGRVIANTGTNYKKTFSFNCYGAQRSTKPYDSIENIYNDLKNSAQILKTEGGVGMNFNHLRPQGTLIKGIRVGTPGVVAFMELYDKSAEIITRGNVGDILQKNDEITKNKIRKGAQIGMLDIRHPEIVRYIEAKKRPNFLTKFNMSVAIIDEFMEAVVDDEDFDLWFPDIHFEKYDKEWAGDFDDWEDNGYPKVVYETIKARKLWDIVIKNCYNRNEPGIFFIDNANRYNNLKYYQKVTGTNPCLHPDSIIETIHGRVKIKDIKEPTMVYTMLSDGSLGIKKCGASFISKENTKTLVIETRNGKKIRCTEEHKIFLHDKGWVEAKDIVNGDRLVQLCRARRGVAYSGVKLSTQDNRDYQMEHRMIADAVYGIFVSDDVHHIDGDTYNNCIDNFEVLSHSDHSKYTALNDNPQTHQKKGECGKFIKTGISTKVIVPMPEELRSNMKNQFSNAVVSISEGEKIDVYDLTVEDTHNFIADFTVVHNCGEICMLADSGVFEYKGVIYEHLGDICNLGHINLVSYWKDGLFDWQQLKCDIALLVESLDNLIDISGYPLDELKNSAMLRRKIGCGVMGYGSLLMMMGMRYGSEEANKFTEQLMSFYANHAYRASAELARDKGSFPLYDEKEFLNNGYVKNSGVLDDLTIGMIKEFGIRNSQMLTMAPTGTTGILVGLVSGGGEPEFDLEYDRWVTVNHKINSLLEGLVYPNVLDGEWKETKDFKLSIDGDEEVLLSTCGNFKFDKNRGLTKKVRVLSYGWRWVKENLSEEEIKNNEGVYATAMELSVEEHLEPFKILSKYVDNSISKTINLRKDYPYEEFSNLFIDLWKNGVRGVTTYRDGTMTSVLDSSKKESEKTENTQEKFFEVWKEHGDNVVREDIQIPDEYVMHGYKIKSEGKKWYVHLCFKDDEKRKPFAIFCQTNHREAEVNTYDTLDQLEILARKSKIPKKFRDDNKKKYNGQTNVNKITRTIGLLLRHNVNIGSIVSTLDKVDVPVSSFIYRIKKFLLKFTEDITLSEKCPECKENLMMVEGCSKCRCGYSKC